MEWSVEAIERLRALWAEGLSTAEIGRRMGVSKNAVVGKAHRLNLPPRPSPIRRDPAAPRVPMPRVAMPRVAASRTAAPPAPLAAPRRPLPGVAAVVGPMAALRRPLAAETGRARAVMPPGATPAAATTAGGAQPAPAPRPAPAVVRSFPRLGGAARSCCWPIGEPGTPDFHFCGAEALTGKPYCAEHAAVAYVKVRDRREDAA